ncbi:hypothetical protein C8R45DRAFT_1111476 [Mycena sanguinolenta]|nr:hypothetical protein C8R45DRAFT_1111476 [Mycena sanguinolenta]
MSTSPKFDPSPVSAYICLFTAYRISASGYRNRSRILPGPRDERRESLYICCTVTQAARCGGERHKIQWAFLPLAARPTSLIDHIKIALKMRKYRGSRGSSMTSRSCLTVAPLCRCYSISATTSTSSISTITDRRSPCPLRHDACSTLVDDILPAGYPNSKAQRQPPQLDLSGRCALVRAADSSGNANNHPAAGISRAMAPLQYAQPLRH